MKRVSEITIRDIEESKWASDNFRAFKGRNIMAEHKRDYPEQC